MPRSKLSILEKFKLLKNLQAAKAYSTNSHVPLMCNAINQLVTVLTSF